MAKNTEKATVAPAPALVGSVAQEQSEHNAPAVSGALATVPTEANTSVAVSMDDLFAEHAGQGMEGMKAGDFAIPFLAIAQKASPQVSKNNAKFINGLQTGDLFNTVSLKTWKATVGVLAIPCGYNKTLVRWKSRDSGGGLVCQYKENDPALKSFTRDERGRLFDAESGDVIIDTAYHFILIIDEDEAPQFAVISMSSTQLKASRNWNSTMRAIMKKHPKTGQLFNPPSFSHMYRLTTLGQVKDSYDWEGWRIVSEGEVTDPNIFKLALDFAKQVSSGDVKVSAPPSQFDDVENPEKGDVPF